MVSYTAQTDRRRQIRLKKAGRRAAHLRLLAGTPKFPVHPENYNPAAADAKKA